MIPQFLYGERGDRPVSIRLLDASQAQQVSRAFPGSINMGRTIKCTWDVQAQIFAAVGYSPKPLPDPNSIIATLDIDRFERMGMTKKLRKYQLEGALFLAQRSGVMTADEMRLGKTHQAVAGSVLAGSRKTLVLAPAMVRRVWPKTIAWLTGLKTIVLEGRAGTLGRVVCDCLMLGCEQCRGKGFVIVKGDACAQALADAEYAFVNYDILQPQYRRDDAKMMHEDPALPGWGRKLAGMKWDTIIGDESHRFRGFSTSTAKQGRRRFDFIQLVTDSARQVILATGTPIATYVRDLYTQLDVMTKGASAGGWKRNPFAWQVAYADAGHDEETGYWVSTGLSARALLEIGPRMSHLMIRRLQKDVFSQLPPKSEEVLRLPASKSALQASRAALHGRGNSRDRIKKALVATTDSKMSQLVAPITEFVLGGGKGLVLVYLKEARRKLTAALQKTIEGWDPTKHDPKKMPRVFSFDGDVTVDKRLKLAEEYVDHGGGAIAVATMDSVTEGISMKGGTIVWFLDLHDVPATISQVSQRIWDPSMPSMSVIYCVMEGAADDRYVIGLRKKIKAQESIGDTSLSGFADQVKHEKIDFDDLLGDMISSIEAESNRDLDEELRELGVEI